jgi:hypothetical protein
MKASRCGLVVKAEDSRLRSLGFKSPLNRPLFMHHAFGSKHGTKEIIESSKEPGIVAYAVIAQMGGWNLRMEL